MTSDVRILLVDDNDAARFIKSQILRRTGYAVTEARTGRDALAAAATNRPDLVVLDVNLPDMSGLEVCRVLKQDFGSPTIQVLQVSQTAVSDADQVRGLDQGADMYLIEPLSPPVLLACVRALLRVRQAEDELARALEGEREARAEAERASRTKDDFIAMVSHELRTPLNAMTGWIWQLKHSQLDRAMQDRAIDSLDRNAQVQVQLINDLLDLSKISTGNLDVELQPIDVAPIVTATTEAAVESPAHLRKNIRLTVRAAPAIVLGDAARLQQVVTNLLNNAYQFTPMGGTITVSCGTAQGRAFIRVEDSGAGIDPAFLPHVFERFRQERALATSRERGLGLGLAIVHHLVERHHGTVALESEGLGRGTTCTVSLPLVDDADVEQVTARELPTSTLDGVVILLIEDDPDALNALDRILTQYGATVIPVDTAAAADKRISSLAFDVLVSDVGLPDGSGSDLLKRLRARGHMTPAVAVTAFATAADRRRLLADGFAAHVAKPIDPERLVRVVAQAAGVGIRRPTASS